MCKSPIPAVPLKSITPYTYQLHRLELKKDYIGEPVSQIEHMVQAAMAAEAEGRSKERLIRPELSRKLVPVN